MSTSYITYTNGFEITNDILDNILHGDFKDILSKGLESYNTAGKMIQHKTVKGNVVSIPMLTTSDKVDIIREMFYVSDSIISGQAIVNRTPIMYSAKKSCNEGTFIEIDKQCKTLYFIKDGNVELEISITRGIDDYKPLSNGVYSVLSKQKQGDAYLGNWKLDNRYPKIRLGLTGEGIGIQNLGYVDNKGSISIEPSKSELLYSLVDINTPVYVY